MEQPAPGGLFCILTDMSAIELLPQKPNPAADIILPNGIKPSNLHLPPGTKIEYIHSDVFNICARLKEIDSSLYVVLLSNSDLEQYVWAIMEDCRDGEQRLVFKAKELDARVLDRLHKLMALPLKDRIAKIDQENKKREAEREELRKEAMIENVALPMYRELESTGFLQRPVSYPKRGVKPKIS